jgi:hypothetical protein
MVGPPHHCGSDSDQSDHRAKHAGPQPIGVLPWKDRRSCSLPTNKGHIWRCREGNARLQGSLHQECSSAPQFPDDCRKVSPKNRPT